MNPNQKGLFNIQKSNLSISDCVIDNVLDSDDSLYLYSSTQNKEYSKDGQYRVLDIIDNKVQYY